MVKKSDMFDMNKVKGILSSLGLAAAFGGGIAGAGALIDFTKSKLREMRLPAYFRKMLEKNPDLAEEYQKKESREKIEDLFKLLEDFAPNLVENPLSAGTFIRQLYKYGDLAASPDHIQTLTSINKNIADSNKGKTDWGGAVTQKLFNIGIDQSETIKPNSSGGFDTVESFGTKI